MYRDIKCKIAVAIAAVKNMKYSSKANGLKF